MALQTYPYCLWFTVNLPTLDTWRRPYRDGWREYISQFTAFVIFDVQTTKCLPSYNVLNTKMFRHQKSQM